MAKVNPINAATAGSDVQVTNTNNTQQQNNENNNIYEAQFSNKDVNANIGLEVETTTNNEQEVQKDESNAARKVTRFEVKSYLKDPANIESDQYQNILDEINKLNAKGELTSAEKIRLSNLQRDLKQIEQRVRFKLLSNDTPEKENPDVITKNNAKHLLNAEIITITDTQKVNNEETEDENDTKNETNNTYGIKLTGLYKKENTTAGMEVTIGNNYQLNASFEHIKNASSFAFGASAEITEDTDIDASANVDYSYVKNKTIISAKGNYNIFSTKVAGTRENLQNGDVTLNVYTPHFEANAGAEFSDLGTTYTASLGGTYSKEFKNGVSFDGYVNGGYQYLDSFKIHNANFGLNAKVGYKDDNIQGYACIDARGDYSKSKEFDFEDYNVSASIDLGLKASNVDFHTNYTYEKSMEQSGLQYGVGLGYTFPESRIGVIADYSGSIMLSGEEAEIQQAISPKHKINIRFKAPIGQYIHALTENKQNEAKEKLKEHEL